MERAIKETIELGAKLRAESYVARCIAVSVKARAFALRRTAAALTHALKTQRGIVKTRGRSLRG